MYFKTYSILYNTAKACFLSMIYWRIVGIQSNKYSVIHKCCQTKLWKYVVLSIISSVLPIPKTWFKLLDSLSNEHSFPT